MKKCIFLTSVVIIGLLAGGCGSSSASSGYKAPAADQPAAETQGFVSQLFDDASGGGSTGGSGEDSYFKGGLDTDPLKDTALIPDTSGEGSPAGDSWQTPIMEPASDEPDVEDNSKKSVNLPEELFRVPSTEYNNNIAKFAVELCQKGDDYYDEKLVSEYRRRGAEDVKTYNFSEQGSLHWVDFFTNGGGAAAIGHFLCDDGTVFLVITARGSKTLQEFIGDKAKGWSNDPDKVHWFLGHYVWDNTYQFWYKVEQGMVDYLSVHPEIRKAEKLRVLVTGHSLGGAAANMYGAVLDSGLEEGEWWSGCTTKDAIYVYTFGAIEVLNVDKNVSSGYENIHNIYNYYDSFGPNGNQAKHHASSPYAKFGHTDIYQDEELHYKEEDSAFSSANHNLDNYRNAIELNEKRPVIKLQCGGEGDAHELNLDTGDFKIEGTWLSVGLSGYGQAQPGKMVYFDGKYVNFVSPQDSYVLYRDVDGLYLSCTTNFSSDTLIFRVSVQDNDHIVILKDNTSTELKRCEYYEPNPDTENFKIEGTWRSVGDYGLGQAQPGSTVTFDGSYVNFVSPQDTYKLYREGDGLYLSCTTLFFGDTLILKVNILDNNHVNFEYGGSVTELVREGW